jgi:hypothetical protein
MNRDDIIRMAKQASGSEWSIFQDFMPELERFAALVAAAEREACAKVAENQWETVGTQRRTAERCAAAIRARGE